MTQRQRSAAYAAHQGDCVSDTLYLDCLYCDKRIATKEVSCDRKLTPSEAARWHERMAKHLRAKHVGKRK